MNSQRLIRRTSQLSTCCFDSAAGDRPKTKAQMKIEANSRERHLGRRGSAQTAIKSPGIQHREEDRVQLTWLARIVM